MTQPITILIATGNPGKAREIEAVLSTAATSHDVALASHPCESDETSNAPKDASTQSKPTICIEWKTLKDLGIDIPEPVEDGRTFAENAALKARYYSKVTGLWTLADDSGLEVDALGGDPGVRSARFSEDLPEAAPRALRDPANNAKLIRLLAGIPDEKRTARFHCALALADGHQILATADGLIEGCIIDTPRGENGFGYDPHFLVISMNQTTAEIDPAEKNKISHRGQALQIMCGKLQALLEGGTATNPK